METKLCTTCGKKLSSNNKSGYCHKCFLKSDERKQRMAEYNKSLKAREARRKYQKSDKGRVVHRAACKRFNATPDRVEYNKKYRKTEQCKAVIKKWKKTENGIESIKKYKNSDKYKENLKRYNASEERRLKVKEYSKTSRNKPEYKEYHRHRIESNPVLRLGNKVRKLILACLKLRGFSKKTKTYQLLGCDYGEFLLHVGEKPDGNYHLDHICPCAQAQNEEEIMKLQHYTNLRWLGATENILKRDLKTEEGEKLCIALLGREWIE